MKRNLFQLAICGVPLALLVVGATSVSLSPGRFVGTHVGDGSGLAIPLASITNLGYLTNWTQIDTNSFASAPQTNISWLAITNLDSAAFDGAAVTNLNASALASGTVPVAVLPDPMTLSQVNATDLYATNLYTSITNSLLAGDANGKPSAGTSAQVNTSAHENSIHLRNPSPLI